MSLTGLVIVFAVMFVAAVPLSSDTLRHRIVLYLSDKLDSEVELGDLHLRAFPRLRVEGADLRIRRRGMADFPPLIAIKSFHVEASIMGLYRKHVDHVRLDGLDINIPPSQVRDKQKSEAKSHEGRSDGRSDQNRRAEEQRRDPLKDGGIVIDRMDTNDARLIILPFERDKAAEGLGDSQPPHARSRRAAAVAVQGDADQRRAPRRDRRQRHVRTVAPRRTGRHAARAASSTSRRRISASSRASPARCRRTATSAARWRSSRPTARPTRRISRSRSAAIRFRST